jgi:hypothetical protein
MRGHICWTDDTYCRECGSKRSSVILTDKGERWMLNLLGYGRAGLIIVSIVALIGFAGYIEGL